MSSLADYKAFIEELNSIRTSAGIRLGLERIRELLARLGNPQEAFSSIVVSGTNGKGSVVAMLSGVLKHAGYRVGSYISPHLYDIRERISVNGCWIDKSSFLEIGKEVLSVAESMEDFPSFYEIMTAVAFMFFRKREIDIALLEVGLGGRLDAVNVVDPLHCVITTVDYDHEGYLGSRIEDIAREKAGIVKRGVSVVLGEKKEEAVKVVEGVCREQEAFLRRIERDFSFKVVKLESSLEKASIMDFSGEGKDINSIEIGLKGNYQFLNASLAIESSLVLNGKGVRISESSIRKGIKSTKWKGRFDVRRLGNKIVVFDGAHNPHGAEALTSSLKLFFPEDKICFVFGVMRDKKYEKMLISLSSIANSFLFTSVGTERALTIGELEEVGNRLLVGKGIEFRGVEEPLAAFEMALSMPERVICVCGSLYLVGKILEALEKKEC